MRKLVCVLLVFAMAIPAFAQQLHVTGTPPEVSGSSVSGFNNANIATAFSQILTELNSQFSNISYNNPQKFLQGMGNSSVYASHGATTRAYGGYKRFSATLGSTVGLQLPESLLTIYDNVDGISDSLEREGDINLGYSPNFFNASVGINMGVIKFLPKHLGFLKRDNLYVGLRAGYFSLPPGFLEDISYKSLTLGITANYQLIPTVGVGVIKWRGVNLGTGFIYNSSSFGISGLPMGGEIKKPIVSGYNLVIEPKAYMNMDVTTYTIPLEAVTAIKLLIFNIPFGLGADIAFGKASADFGLSSDVNYDNLPSGYTQVKKGDITVSGGVSNSPSIFNFKIMTGIGVNFGPVVLDVPITIYPAVNGYSFGITAGAVF